MRPNNSSFLAFGCRRCGLSASGRVFASGSYENMESDLLVTRCIYKKETRLFYSNSVEEKANATLLDSTITSLQQNLIRLKVTLTVNRNRSFGEGPTTHIIYLTITVKILYFCTLFLDTSGKILLMMAVFYLRKSSAHRSIESEN